MDSSLFNQLRDEWPSFHVHLDLGQMPLTSAYRYKVAANATNVTSTRHSISCP
jgi:hypothetical protein